MKDKLKIKQVFTKDSSTYCHCKIVCVDRKMVCVGSDNTYPCYSEEHGIWIGEILLP